MDKFSRSFGLGNPLNHAIAAGLGTTAVNMARRFRGLGGRPINAQQRYDLPRIARRARTARRRATMTTVMRNRGSRSGLLGGTNAMQRAIYRKGRMPGRKKKAWKRFAKKVQFLKDKDLGLQTVLFNDKITQQGNTVASANQAQNTLTLGLYTLNSLTYGYLNDLKEISGLDNFGNPTATAGTTVNQNTKLMFHTAVMDLTLRNTSTIVNGDNSVQVAPEAAIELDVYEIRVREDTESSTINYSSITGLLNSFDSDEIGGTGSGVSISDRGATPFEMSPGLSRWGIKVLSKTKYFIPGGQTITHQVRDPKRRVCTYADINSESGFNKPRWTRFLYLVYKLVPGFTIGTLPGNYRCNIVVGSTRKYGYKIEGRSEPRERYITRDYTPGANA